MTHLIPYLVTRATPPVGPGRLLPVS